ncbi:MAG TPA: hypothetical protein VGG61_16670 [Gemmataceae bacterium]
MSDRVAAATLRPPDDGKELDAALAQPRAFLARREGNVSLGPPPGPLILFAVEGGRPHPVLQGKIIRIANAHAPLLGGVDEEDAAERPEGLPTKRSFRFLVDDNDIAPRLDQLRGGDEPGQPAANDDDVRVVSHHASQDCSAIAE